MPLNADVPLDEVVYLDFITSRFDTGAATDADSTPTFEVFEESTDTDIGVGGNATKRTSKTGNYRVTFTCSAANGFEVGKWYSVVASATVNSVAGKGIIGTFRIVLAESVAGEPKVDVGAFGGSPGTFASGIPEVKVASIAANAITATSINADAITNAKIADDAIAVENIKDAAITAAKIATDAIDADALAADALAEILAQVNAALTATIADSVPADGTRPSIASGIYMLVQFMLERAVVGTTMTVKKPDGSTTLLTLTLDDAVEPTSVTRS